MISLALTLPWWDWDSLDAVRRAHSDLEAAAIAGFAFLVALDSAAHLLEKNHPARARVAAGIGLAFFWLAVGAEIVAYRYGQRNDELSSDQIRSLDTVAKEAKTKAGEAKSTADAANRVAGEAKGNADAVSKEADALALRLSQTKKVVDFETPRRQILFAAAPKIVPLLKPYAGQRVSLWVCESNRHDFEVMETWGVIAQILANEKPAPGVIAGANWKEVPTNLNFSQSRCGSMGIGIGVSKNASEQTREAAKALSDSLFKALPPSIYNHFGENDPEKIRRTRALGYLDEASPLMMQVSDPDLIIVGIDAHPTQ